MPGRLLFGRSTLAVGLMAASCVAVDGPGGADERAAADQANPPSAESVAPVAPPVAAVAPSVAAVAPAADPEPPMGMAPPPEPEALGDTLHPRPSSTPAITPADVLAELERVRAENSSRYNLDWQSQAADLIARDPKLGEQIAGLLMESTSNFLVRSEGLRLLTMRGDANGQAAMQKVLADPGVRADSMYHILVLCMVYMPRPTDETVDLARSLRTSEDPHVRRSATQVLGGQISALIASKRMDAATRLDTELSAALRASRDPQEQATIVEALGRGGLPRTRGLVRGFGRSKDPALRRAAARGLKYEDSAATVALMIALLVDPDPEVQAEAVEVLIERALSPAQQRTVHAAIMKGQVKPPSDMMLVFLVDRRLVGEARTQALELLLARNPEDSRVSDQIREVQRR